MKKLALVIAVLPVLGCAAEGEDASSAAPLANGTASALRALVEDTRSAPDAQKTLTVQTRGTMLHKLPAMLKDSGVRLEISPAISDRALEIDSAGKPLAQVLEQVASAVGGQLSYAGGAYRILPVVVESEPPVEVESDSTDRPALWGALPPEDIKRVISTHAARVRYCYEKALTERSQNLEGKVFVHFVIEPTGKVSNAKVRESTLGDGPMEDCILDVIRTMVFPEPSGNGRVEVNYPFVFKAS